MEPTKSNEIPLRTKSLLTDIDNFADRLVQIGYFNQKQRDFLGEFIYKSEAALSAAKSSLSCDIPEAKKTPTSTKGAIRQPSTASASTPLAKDDIQLEDAKATDTRITKDRTDEMTFDDTTKYRPGKTSKYTVAFVRASEISTSFTPESLNPAPATFAPTSTTPAWKRDKPRPVKTNAWGRIDPTCNDDGDIVGEFAPPVGSVGKVGKGKAMMEKMGWTTGMGLGKENKGIREPVAITVKTDRTGLGGNVSKSGAGAKDSTPAEALTSPLAAKASTLDAVVDATDISDCGSSLGEDTTAEYNPAPETSADIVCHLDVDIEGIDDGEEDWDRVPDRSTRVKPSKKRRAKSGIDVNIIAEGKNKKQSIKFSAFITSTRKTKQLWQQAGVIVEAISAQDAVPAGHRTPGLMGVRAGDHLEIKARRVGFGYEATNLRTKESGLVKIARLIMTEYNEPEEKVSMWTGSSWSPLSGRSVAENFSF